MKLNWTKQILSLAIALAMVLSWVPVLSASAEDTGTAVPEEVTNGTVVWDVEKKPLPDGLYMVWNMDDLDTTNWTGGYSNVTTLMGTEYLGGKALEWKVVNAEWHPNYTVPIGNWDFSGATEMWFWVDASNWNYQLGIGVSVQDVNGKHYPIGGEATFGTVEYYFYDDNGTKQTKNLGSWGWMLELPSQYVGWLGISLEDLAQAMPDVGVDMTKITKLEIAISSTRNHIPGDTVIFDDIAINAEPGESGGLDESGWYTDKEEVTDYAYSMVIVGDTQIITQSHPDKLHSIYDWIVENAEDKNMQFVFGMGDITHGTAPAEWEVAYREISKMNGVVPYSLCIGNHDAYYDFNNTFKQGSYTDSIEGTYSASIENSWRTLKVGNIDYLIMTIDYGAGDAVLEWAGEVVNAHPGHNVIITTHGYLDSTGELREDFGDYVCDYSGPYNHGDGIWDKLISKYPNIVMVLCGHIESENIVMTQTAGDHGNMVTQMLVNPQDMDTMDPTGMVATLYFSEDGSKVTVEYYSTIKEQYWKSSNQFEFDLAVVDPNAEAITPPEKEEEALPPELSTGTVVWDMEELPESFNGVASDLFTELWGSNVGFAAGNWVPSAAAGKGYNGSTALSWEMLNTAWGNTTYIDFSDMDNAVTDWSGATELMFYIDVTPVGADIPVDILLAHDADGSSHIAGSAWYYWKDGQWVEQAVNVHGHMVIPGDFAGWVRMPLATLTDEPSLASVERIAFYTEHKLVNGEIYYDHFMINVEPKQQPENPGDDVQPEPPAQTGDASMAIPAMVAVIVSAAAVVVILKKKFAI